MGISLLPPSTEKDAAEGEDPKVVASRINALVLIDDSGLKRMSADELHEKVQKTIELVDKFKEHKTKIYLKKLRNSFQEVNNLLPTGILMKLITGISLLLLLKF